MFVPPPLS